MVDVQARFWWRWVSWTAGIASTFGGGCSSGQQMAVRIRQRRHKVDEAGNVKQVVSLYSMENRACFEVAARR